MFSVLFCGFFFVFFSGMNVCVPQNSHVEALTPSAMIFGAEALGGH